MLEACSKTNKNGSWALLCRYTGILLQGRQRDSHQLSWSFWRPSSPHSPRLSATSQSARDRLPLGIERAESCTANGGERGYSSLILLYMIPVGNYVLVALDIKKAFTPDCNINLGRCFCAAHDKSVPALLAVHSDISESCFLQVDVDVNRLLL